MKPRDCWNHIGLWGDASCPELAAAVHCRNCSRYSAAATELLDRPVDAAYLEASAAEIRRVPASSETLTKAVLIFRVGSEWLALPAEVFHEVCSLRPIHSLPHRRQGHLLGLANVRGALLICISLHRLLGIETSPPPVGARTLTIGRLLVAGAVESRFVFPVDEVFGVHRYDPAQLSHLPGTISNGKATFSRAVLPWQERAVGVLDEGRLFSSLNQTLA